MSVELTQRIIHVKDNGTYDSLDIFRGAPGEKGDKGDTGQGLIPGGSTGQVLKKKSGTDYDTEWANDASAVTDVQVNGTSIVNQGVANVPLADAYTVGVLQIGADYGITKGGGARAYLSKATDAQLKAGEQTYKPVVSSNAYLATFYGLAKAAGSDEKNSTLAVGTYTDEAKKAIREMLGIPNMNGELINTVTVAEDSTSVDITTDSNGLPFSLRIAKIVVELPASTTGTADYIAVKYRGLNQSDTLSGWKDGPSLKMVASTKSKFVYEFESYGAFNFLRGAVARENGSTSDSIRTMFASEEYKAIEQFRVYQYNSSSTLIPAGTVIKIYGVRV